MPFLPRQETPPPDGSNGCCTDGAKINLIVSKRP
jgi:hypothetical protein